MTATTLPQPKDIILTVDDVRRWKADLLHNQKEILRLSNENESLSAKLAAASYFLDVEALGESVKSEEQLASKYSKPTILAEVDVPKVVANPRRRRSQFQPVWADVILKAVQSSEMGLTYAEMRKYAIGSVLGEKLKSSDKGYHNAIGRLARDGSIIRQYGRLFNKSAYERFQAAVDAGTVSRVVAMPFVHSPMGEAILKIVNANPGIIGKEIIGKLREDVEFNATLTPHETGAYNIIARLVKRRQIVRRDDGGCIAGPDFPKELIGRNSDVGGALNGKTVSAPIVSEGGNLRLFSNS